MTLMRRSQMQKDILYESIYIKFRNERNSTNERRDSYVDGKTQKAKE